MKSITRILTVAAFFGSALLSCEKPEPGPQETPDTVINASTLFTSPSGEFSWKADDAILAVDGQSSFTLNATEADGSTAKFAAKLENAPELTAAIYPVGKVLAYSDNTLKLASLEAQTPSSLPVYLFASVEAGQAEFKSVLCYLKVDLDTPAESIKISGGDGEFIAGDILVNAETGAVSIENGKTEIVLRKDEGELTAGVYHIAMLPIAVESGLKLSVCSSNGKVKEHTLDSFSPAAGDVVEFGHVTELLPVTKWTWGLDWETRKANFDFDNAVINENDGFGTIRFVHTHENADYLVGEVTAEKIDTATFCFPENHELSYGSYGARKDDYWKIRCENIAVKKDSRIRVKFLVKGNNQSLVFWNGAYVCDESEPVLLPSEKKTYAWTKTGKKSPSWTVEGTARYVLGYDISAPSAASCIPHISEETITVPEYIDSAFEFRLIVADDTVFSKATIAFKSATMRSDPIHNLAFLASEEVTAITVEVLQ